MATRKNSEGEQDQELYRNGYYITINNENANPNQMKKNWCFGCQESTHPCLPMPSFNTGPMHSPLKKFNKLKQW